jgi:hypothetical protein
MIIILWFFFVAFVPARRLFGGLKYYSRCWCLS